MSTNSPRLLLVEDDAPLAASLVKVLVGEGLPTEHAAAGDTGWALARAGGFDLVITDLRLPGLGGLELVERLHREQPHTPAILITAHGTAETAIEATKRGAYDFLIKPFPIPEFLDCVQRALAQTRHSRRTQAPTAATDDRTLLLGRSAAMREAFKEIGRIAPRPVTVLIRGETGTGKEMVARALWRHGGRETKPFLAINCAAIPENLLESELFGHEKGAFTGAETRRIGRFEQADGGTLFLDEIGDITLATQAKLLRVLQERVIHRVGGKDAIPIDVRIVAATHRRLEDEIAAGRFREDLFYRLNVAQLVLPPLRERPEDVAPLAAAFAERHAVEMAVVFGGFTPEAIAALERHVWPGNVRELENVVRKCLLSARGFAVGAEEVDRAVAAPPQCATAGAAGSASQLGEFIERHLRVAISADTGSAHSEVIAAVEAELFRRALGHSGGNLSQAARWLGISRLTLREKLQRHRLAASIDD
jgi:DNA-binding NtrC family response regulator